MKLAELVPPVRQRKPGSSVHKVMVREVPKALAH